MKETNIYEFEKGIFGCDETRECRMETARTVREPWQ
jgi:flagellar assembly factor FliW